MSGVGELTRLSVQNTWSTNMNRLVLGIVSLVACIALLMAATEPALTTNAFMTSASLGEGSMSFGDDEHGRAWLKFSIQDGDPISGSLLFAAESHHEVEQVSSMMFPDVIVRLTSFEKYSFKNKIVKFSGPGTLHNDPVSVKVVAYDNEGSKREDRFVIKVTDENGHIVFEADGYLFRGNIQVGGE